MDLDLSNGGGHGYADAMVRSARLPHLSITVRNFGFAHDGRRQLKKAESFTFPVSVTRRTEFCVDTALRTGCRRGGIGFWKSIETGVARSPLEEAYVNCAQL